MKKLPAQLKRQQHPNMSTLCLRLFLVHIAFHVLVVAQNPPTLPATNPVYLDMIYGSEDDPITVFEWYVPHKFYRMTSIVGYLYPVGSVYYTMPGFRVTFEADPYTSGWAPIEQDFGNVGVGYTPDTVDLNFANELTEVATCVDDIWGPIPGGYKADLERIKFKESDGNEQQMGADYMCSGGLSSDNLEDLGGRLIGFVVRVSFAYSPGVTCDVITSIQMIIDSENCEDAYWEPAASTSVDISPVSHAHNSDSSTSTVNVSFLTLTNVWSGTCAFTSSLTKPNSESFISYNDSSMTFTLGSTDVCDVGDHTGFSLDLQASQHTVYLTNPTATYPFTVHITCPITHLTINPSPGDTIYQIGDTDSNVNAFDLVVLPSICYCSSHPSYTVTYTKVATIVTQPSFVQGDPAVAKKFDFDGTDPSEAGVYTITITSEIPVDDGTGSNWSTTAEFTLTVTADPCAIATVNIQSSILSTPYQIVYDIWSGPHDEDFVPGDVVVSEVVTCPLEYAVTFRTGSAISPPFTYDSLTMTFTIDSTDPLDANTYEMTITVNLQGQTNTDSVDFDIVMVDQCAGVTLTINPAILAQISLPYDIGEGQRVQALDPSIADISPTPSVSCPAIVFSFDDQSGGPIDPAAFTYDAAAQEFLTETSDPTMKGFYPMRMLANFDGYPISGLPANAELTYQGELIDTCETTTLTINPTLLSTLAIEYTIGDPSHDETLDPSLVTASPAPITSCPGIVFTFEEQGTGLPMDLTVFDYDDVTQIFKTESSDPSKANTYFYKIKANYEGYTNAGTLHFTVTVTEDPCATTSLSIDNAMFLQFPLITYNIKDAAHVETFDNTLGNYVTSIPDVSGSGCPVIVFELLDQTGGALDPTVFSYNLAMAFATYSTDFGKAAMYDIRLTANFIGYTNAAALDFDVLLLDVCAETTLTINNQILSGSAIMYTIVDTAHVETLDDTLGNAVTESPSVTGYGCPAIEFTIDDRSGGAIDSTVFTHAAPTFTTYSTDLTKAGDHLMRVLANFVGYPTQAEYPFQVTMVDPCQVTALTIDNTILSTFPTITYNIKDSAQIESFDDTLGVKVTSNPDVSGSGCPAIEFTLEDQLGAAIDPAVFTFNAGTLTTYSADFLKAGSYNFRLTSNFIGYTNTATLDFDIVLVDMCDSTTLTISGSILSTSAITYMITEPIHQESLDNVLGNSVTASPSVTGYGCPAIEFSIDDRLGGAIDSSVFTYSAPLFTVYSTDLTKAGDHLMRVLANFVGYPTQAEHLFQITMVDPCAATSLSIDPSILSSLAIDYTIKAPPWVENLDINKVTSSPDVSAAGCPAILFSFEDTNTGGAMDPALFTYDPIAETFETSSNDLLDAGTHQLRLIANFNGYTNSVFLDFTVTLNDPCSAATLTIDSSILSQVTLTYVIGYIAHVETLDNTLGVKVTASPDVSSFGCPNIVFQVQTQAGGAIDAAVFTFDAVAQTIETESFDLEKADNYPLKLIANFDGYSNTAELDFDMTLLVNLFFIEIEEVAPRFISLKQSYNITRLVDEAGNLLENKATRLELADIIDRDQISLDSALSNDKEEDFFVFDQETSSISVLPNALAGNYTLTIMLRDMNQEDPIEGRYSFELSVLNQVVLYNTTEELLLTNEPPSLEIVRISNRGVVDVRFSQDLYQINNLTTINSTVIQLEIVPDEPDTDMTLLEFTWNITDFTPSTMTIHMYFTKPAYVSSRSVRDQLLLTILDAHSFKSKESMLSLTEGEKLAYTIPSQLTLSRANDLLISSVGSIETVTNTALVGNFIINIFISGALNFLWGMINCLQIIAYFPLINVTTPANCQIMFRIIVRIATFDMISVDGIIDWLSEYVDSTPDRKPVGAQFHEFGYEQSNPVRNLEIVFLGIIAIILLIIVLKLVELICSTCRRASQAIRSFKETKLYWNLIIRYTLEIYMELSVCSMIRIKAFKFETTGDIILTVYAFATIALLIAFFAWTVLFLPKYFQTFKEKQFQDKYGAVVLGLQYRNKSAMYTPAVFMIRRLIFAMTVTLLANYNFYQIQILVFKTSMMMAFTGQVRPFKLPFQNRLDILNEVLTLICTYQIITFTDFVPDADAQYTHGWVLIGLTLLILFINIIVIVYLAISQSIRTGRLKLRKRSYMQQMRRRESQILKRELLVEQTAKLNRNPMRQLGNFTFQADDTINAPLRDSPSQVDLKITKTQQPRKVLSPQKAMKQQLESISELEIESQSSVPDSPYNVLTPNIQLRCNQEVANIAPVNLNGQKQSYAAQQTLEQFVAESMWDFQIEPIDIPQLKEPPVQLNNKEPLQQKKYFNLETRQQIKKRKREPQCTCLFEKWGLLRHEDDCELNKERHFTRMLDMN